ncbi:beta-class carbonic anhydrase [Virgibacillus kekensis]|uniref:carbonic anhydrase n=1 Tax=Virgibacillus kekensis TaxID=202261 RepID=A0ABV9DJK4_9BACI
MRLLDEILSFNEQFVKNKEYEKYERSKFPNKKLVILSCMDTRLVELLPKSMNLRNGDVKIVKNAGAIVAHPFGSIMKSILVAVYALKADEVCVIGHRDCGMTKLDADTMLDQMKERGVSQETLNTLEYSGVDFGKFLQGFDNVEDSVMSSTSVIRNHPLLPSDVPVHGLVISPETGKLDLVIDGYEE